MALRRAFERPGGSALPAGGTSGTFLRGDGTWATGGASSLAISASTAGLPVNPNLSDLGAVDWAAYDTGQQNGDLFFTTTTPPGLHYKATDGRLYRGTRILTSGGSAFTFGQSGGNPTRSTTAGDDNASVAMAASATYVLINPTGGTGWGVALVVPVYLGETGTLDLYLRTTDVSVEWTSWFSFDTATVETVSTTSPGAGGNRDVQVTTLYTAGQAGFLWLRGRVTALNAGGASKRILLGYSTLN